MATMPPAMIEAYLTRYYASQTFMADHTILRMLDRKECAMSWGIEFNASSKDKAKEVVDQHVRNTVLPTMVGELIVQLIDDLAYPADKAATTIINVKSHGHIGTNSHGPNIHVDVRTAVLDRT